MGARDEVVRDGGVMPPSQSLLGLHRDIALLKQLSVPTEPRARTSWPMGRQTGRQPLSRSNTANTMGSSGFSDSWPPGSPMTEAETHLPLGTPMRPNTVTSVYRSSFDLFPGRPPAAPLVMRSTEEAEEAVYAARVLESASMPYLYRPVTAVQRAPSVKALRGFEDHDYEVAETARLPDWVNISDAEHGAYDPAGSKHFDHKAIFVAKPTKGARRARRFRIADADED